MVIQCSELFLSQEIEVFLIKIPIPRPMVRSCLDCYMQTTRGI